MRSASRTPNFAEAYDQPDSAPHLQDDYTGAVSDCRRAVRLNRCHFGAMAGMGHAHAHLGQYQQALRCYRAALNIHPRMEGIRQAMRKVATLSRRLNPVA